MVPKPPSCPQCPSRPPLWKDTSRTAPGFEDRWRWYCTHCTRRWAPTPEHRLRFTLFPRVPRHPMR
ncbi:hypothetical protein [Streptomyces sp. WMMC940]|uniref:hypothetical protein n=1 Tax=Streptomyces sp. WMMC940 TaxID=3015153 RepID=UPI0022B671CE|nr:hypothetical protein [Streptomyces sp. WMMC940]MCZ7460507.1 hypothetical protein [Streptomyces sp. WMMC940]